MILCFFLKFFQGDDSVVGCMLLSSGTVEVMTSFNTAYKGTVIELVNIQFLKIFTENIMDSVFQ